MTLCVTRIEYICYIVMSNNTILCIGTYNLECTIIWFIVEVQWCNQTRGCLAPLTKSVAYQKQYIKKYFHNIFQYLLFSYYVMLLVKTGNRWVYTILDGWYRIGSRVGYATCRIGFRLKEVFQMSLICSRFYSGQIVQIYIFKHFFAIRNHNHIYV